MQKKGRSFESGRIGFDLTLTTSSSRNFRVIEQFGFLQGFREFKQFEDIWKFKSLFVFIMLTRFAWDLVLRRFADCWTQILSKNTKILHSHPKSFEDSKLSSSLKQLDLRIKFSRGILEVDRVSSDFYANWRKVYC